MFWREKGGRRKVTLYWVNVGTRWFYTTDSWVWDHHVMDVKEVPITQGHGSKRSIVKRLEGDPRVLKVWGGHIATVEKVEVEI